jgi:hypothetical protein
LEAGLGVPWRELTNDWLSRRAWPRPRSARTTSARC